MTSWVRLWHDMPTDPKWRVIARKSGQRVGDVIAVFNFLMVSASANADERGRTDCFDCEDVAAALDLEETDVQAIVQAMRGKVMDDDGKLTGWEKRQPKREDSSAERAKAWRNERKRTQANAPERPDTDSDAEQLEANAFCPTPPDVPKEDRFAEAWKAYPAKGRERSKSQAKTRPIWREASRQAGGEEALLGAVRRYVREDQTHKGECGPPAFDKWLRDGRWEHWLDLKPHRLATWVGPPEIRARVVAERGDGFAASYLDPAAWTETGEVLAATGYAAEKLRDLGFLRVARFPNQQTT